MPPAAASLRDAPAAAAVGQVPGGQDHLPRRGPDVVRQPGEQPAPFARAAAARGGRWWARDARPRPGRPAAGAPSDRCRCRRTGARSAATEPSWPSPCAAGRPDDSHPAATARPRADGDRRQERVRRAQLARVRDDDVPRAARPSPRTRRHRARGVHRDCRAAAARSTPRCPAPKRDARRIERPDDARRRPGRTQVAMAAATAAAGRGGDTLKTDQTASRRRPRPAAEPHRTSHERDEHDSGKARGSARKPTAAAATPSRKASLLPFVGKMRRHTQPIPSTLMRKSGRGRAAKPGGRSAAAAASARRSYVTMPRSGRGSDRRERSWKIALVWIWQTRLSVTPSTLPISASVSPS